MYFLNINKPKGISSFDVIRILRKKLGIKQIGHSGTLDPLASGVLQIGVGDCTKLLDYLDSDKTYVANIKFGYVTSTFDDEGEKEFVSNPDFSYDDFKDVLMTFLGITKQVPPKYSAVKINGKKACDIIRTKNNIQLEISEREIEIYNISILNFSDYEAQIFVHCKKGVYIRSLVNDIGIKLGCGAYVTELKRVAAGCFRLEDSDKLDSIDYHIINPIDVLPFDKYELNEAEFSRILNGNYINPKQNVSSDKVLLTKDNKLVSFAFLSDNLIKPKKVFRGV